MFNYLYNIKYPSSRVARAEGTTTTPKTDNLDGFWPSLASMVGTIGTTLVSLIGKDDSYTDQTEISVPQKKNTGLYIGIGVSVIVIIGVLIWVIAKKK
jgi:hypothetical protein